jgi:NAD(P)-dependent dehydrogenase (short-subunit alcohol dehydrogenase family)
LIAEVVHGAPSRFSDPARFSFAHGGKDRHPFPVPLKTYDESFDCLRTSLDKAKLGDKDKLDGFHRLERFVRGVETRLKPGANFDVMGALHLAQVVIPDMLKAGHGFLSLTGATAALRGRAGYAPLAIGKSGLRMLGQSLAREFHPKGIHVVHVIVDGQIDTPRLREREPNRPAETVIPPSAIAEAVIACLRQPRTAWSQEIDIRPAVESF